MPVRCDALQRLRVLAIDDSPDDVRLLARELRQSFPDLAWRHVDDAQALDAALRELPWDVVLCDHGVPGLRTAEAIARVRATVPDLPVVVVSGSESATARADARRAGAASFVGKWQLERLPAVIDAIVHSHPRGPRRPPDPLPHGLADPDPQLRAVFDCMLDGVILTDGAGRVRYANRRAGALVGSTPEGLLGQPLPLRLDPPPDGGGPDDGGRVVRADGATVPAEVATAPLASAGAASRLWVVRDRSATRRLRERLARQARHHRERLATTTRRTEQFAWLVAGVRLGCRCAGRILTAQSTEEIVRLVRREILDAAGIGWSDVTVWLRGPASAELAGDPELRLRPDDLLRPWGAARGIAVALAGDHPCAAVVRRGEPVPDHAGTLLVPLRARVGCRGVLSLRWEEAARGFDAAPLRLGLCDVARGIGDALGLALEWRAVVRAERERARRDPVARAASRDWPGTPIGSNGGVATAPLDALAGVSLFAGLTEDELAELLSASKVVSAKAGQVLVTEGQHSGRLCLVLQGTCEVRKNAGDHVRPVSALGEKDVFGEVGLVAPDASASASVVATVPVQLLTWDRDLFRAKLQAGSGAFRKVLGSVAEVLGARLAEMLERWTHLFEAFEKAAPRAAHDAEVDEIRDHFLRAFYA